MSSSDAAATGCKSSAPDFYHILGVPKTASPTAIRAAYKRLAMEFHPDKCDSDHGEKFKEVAQAYRTLSDPAQRREYDNARTKSINLMIPRRFSTKTPTEYYAEMLNESERWSAGELRSWVSELIQQERQQDFDRGYCFEQRRAKEMQRRREFERAHPNFSSHVEDSPYSDKLNQPPPTESTMATALQDSEPAITTSNVLKLPTLTTAVPEVEDTPPTSFLFSYKPHSKVTPSLPYHNPVISTSSTLSYSLRPNPLLPPTANQSTRSRAKSTPSFVRVSSLDLSSTLCNISNHLR